MVDEENVVVKDDVAGEERVVGEDVVAGEEKVAAGESVVGVKTAIDDEHAHQLLSNKKYKELANILKSHLKDNVSLRTAKPLLQELRKEVVEFLDLDKYSSDDGPASSYGGGYDGSRDRLADKVEAFRLMANKKMCVVFKDEFDGDFMRHGHYFDDLLEGTIKYMDSWVYKVFH